MGAPRIGVLALQGDVREHLGMLADVGAHGIAVTQAEQFDDIDGLVIPGGESTVIGRLAELYGLLEPLRKHVRSGLAVYGSCAGLILLADEVLDGKDDQVYVGGLDITVRRNAFGRQVDSFETDVELAGIGSYHGVFIRAPWVERVGGEVEVLGETAGRIVAVRQGRLLATAFHPELTDDTRVHALFVTMCQDIP